MADALRTNLSREITKGTVKVTWEGLDNDDSGLPENVSNFKSITVQIIGTLGGASLTMQGSNDGGTTYATLLDQAGNPCVFSGALGMKLIATVPQLIRPLAAGSGVTDIDVIVLAAV